MMCLPDGPDEGAQTPAEGPLEPGPSGVGGPGPAALSGRVLLVEDNTANLQIIALRLRQDGADVVTASNGQEALERIEESESLNRAFDVVVMDMQMPVIDGYEAVRRLRSRGFDRPIIALTASAREEDRAECLRLGCDEHLFKPVEWDELRATVAARLGGTKSD